MSEHIKREEENGVLHLRLNRPEKKNAMTEDMYRGLADGLKEADGRDDICAVLLSGEGDSFTSGNDLSAFASVLTMDQGTRPPVLDLIEAGLKSETPLIAAVEGWCVGIGATMMLHTDFIYAGRSARFHMPFTELGAVPEAGASHLLTRRFGRQRAAEMMIASKVLPAEKAERWGFITEVVEDGDALAAGKEMAAHIASLPPQSVRDTKKLMTEDLGSILPHTEHELKVFAGRLRSEEMQAVIAKKMARKSG
ncbi:enoyl-CoA hydratase/isomerase family protein [Parvularcula maris]|uniref:Enoyl-CoA hydratase-related protein n=1 Tax=Parvularcula maris TaxID=2965077 RepID=A0A9X2LAZ7_9PROT|nr:enoyl-CoA hydratase-related protein [Parvularcula maris]MCQ8186396.1 enoyl-CoA hydratase-related protein [Parvularcula maris]